MPGGAYTQDGVTLHPNTLLKGAVAIDLYQAGCFKRIITAGGHLNREGKSIGQVIKDDLLSRGVPEEVIRTEDQSKKGIGFVASQQVRS